MGFYNSNSKAYQDVRGVAHVQRRSHRYILTFWTFLTNVNNGHLDVEGNPKCEQRSEMKENLLNKPILVRQPLAHRDALAGDTTNSCSCGLDSPLPCQSAAALSSDSATKFGCCATR